MLSHSTPIVFGFVLTLAFVLLMVTFRSIVVPIKAIIAQPAVGRRPPTACWWPCSRTGMAPSILGFNPTGGVAPWLPLFLFVILFGLSMDYHVFILSRIKELVDRGMSTEDAVARASRARPARSPARRW